ncbi:hypothetical protein ECE50_010135 [Chitinophaga sp. Mgbs1]|uniref:Terpene synthase n=1 Tax=Chitinophaga solisilvae TaxID=1233460 RepID=A0A433WDD4_9BACT|nr:hypothetical protein [Chitinophaga solisilvae]
MDLKITVSNPFGHRVSPYADQIRDISNNWIDAEYSTLTPAFQRMLKTLDAACWASNCWPDAPFPLLCTITRIVLFVTAFDDFYASLSTREVQKAGDRVLAIAGGAVPLPGEHPILQQVSIIMRELTAVSSPQWVQKFIYYLSQLMEGIKIDSQISYRQDVQYPAIRDYIPLRRKSMAAGAISCTIELVAGILPEFICVHPYIQRTRALTEDLMGWGNDLASVEKEMADKEAMNLVLVIKHERNCCMEAAVEEAVQMYNAHVREYMQLRSDMPDFGIYTPAVMKFMEGQGLWLSGQLHWFDQTDRYKPEG